MKRFRYRGLDRNGRHASGRLDAQSVADVWRQLAERGIHAARLQVRRDDLAGRLLGLVGAGWVDVGAAPPSDAAAVHVALPAVPRVTRRRPTTDGPALLPSDLSSRARLVPLHPPNLLPAPLPTIPVEQLNAVAEPQDRKRDRVEEALRAAGIGFGMGSVREQVDRVLAGFVPDDLSDAEQESYFFHRAACVDDDPEEADRRIAAAMKLMPASGRIRILRARRLEDEGEIEAMFDLLDDADYANEARVATDAAHFAYLWDEYDRGLGYLEPVMKRYLDAARQGDRGVPPGLPALGSVAWSAACLGLLGGRLTKVDHWIGEMDEALGGDMDTGVRLWLRARRHGDPPGDLRPLIEHVAGSLTFSDGMVTMQQAVLESQLDADAAGAMRRLGAVRVPPHRADLELLRTLAHAQACDRAGESDRARAGIQRFTERSPLLLAPEMAAFFNQIDVMEDLKQEYRSHRTDS